MGNTASADEKLLDAARKGHSEECGDLIRQEGASVNYKDPVYGATALMVACHKGHVTTAQLLLTNGSSANEFSAVGKKAPVGHRTPLHFACESQNNGVAICKVLLAWGANPSVVDEERVSPIQVARNRGKVDLVHLLEKACAVFEKEMEIKSQGFFKSWTRVRVVVVRVMMEPGEINGICQHHLAWYSVNNETGKPIRSISLAKAHVEEAGISNGRYRLSVTAAEFPFVFAVTSQNERAAVVANMSRACGKFQTPPQARVSMPSQVVQPGQGTVVPLPGHRRSDVPSSSQPAFLQPPPPVAPGAAGSPRGGIPSSGDAGGGAPAGIDEDEQLRLAMEASESQFREEQAARAAAEAQAEASARHMTQQRAELERLRQEQEDLNRALQVSAEASAAMAARSGNAAMEPPPAYRPPSRSFLPASLGGEPSAPPPAVGVAVSGVSLLVAEEGGSGAGAAARSPHDREERNPARAARRAAAAQEEESKAAAAAEVERQRKAAAAAEEKKRSDAEDDANCVVCMEKPKDAVCVPCGHLAACVGCLTDIKESSGVCPICRQPIAEAIRLFKV